VLKHKFMYFINRLHILHSTLPQQLKQRTNKRDIRQNFQSAWKVPLEFPILSRYGSDEALRATVGTNAASDGDKWSAVERYIELNLTVSDNKQICSSRYIM
jgi:hypothetical protein